MKDIDKLKELLNGWDVPFHAEVNQLTICVYVGGCDFELPPSPKVKGYAGFYTMYRFTSEGEFIEMGAWE